MISVEGSENRHSSQFDELLAKLDSVQRSIFKRVLHILANNELGVPTIDEIVSIHTELIGKVGSEEALHSLVDAGLLKLNGRSITATDEVLRAWRLANEKRGMMA